MEHRAELSDLIVVPDWERFQHYKDRHPPWIRVYTRLLHDPKYLGISNASKGLLLTIWLLYSAENGPFSVAVLAKVRGQTVSNAQLMSLNQAGFIELRASTALAPRQRSRSTELPESELPEVGAVEKPQPPDLRAVAASKREQLHNELLTEARRMVENWQAGGSDVFAERLDELERNFHSRLTFHERESLWSKAFSRIPF